MSKVIEDAAQDFAAINDDKAANSAHSYSKYDIADAYQRGADFGYSLAENRVKKEYEEKLRWIPVEEELPTIHVDVILKCESGFWDKGCLIHQSGDNMFSSSSGDLDIVTHWRPISFL